MARLVKIIIKAEKTKGEPASPALTKGNNINCHFHFTLHVLNQ